MSKFKPKESKTDDLTKQDEMENRQSCTARKGKFNNKNRPVHAKQNPIDQWNRYPHLMEAAAALPWNHIIGDGIVGSGIESKDWSTMIIYYDPVVGNNTSASSPLNVTFQKLWVNMNTIFRGLSGYTAPDLGMVCIAVANIFARIAEASRVYGVARYWSERNRATGLNLLKALGFSANFCRDVFNNLADFNMELNLIIEKVKALVLPKGFALTSEWVSLNALVYTDSKDVRAGMIAFVPRGYYHYKDDIEGVPNSLEYLEPVKGDKYIGYLKDINDWVDELLLNHEVTKMCADMQAYLEKKVGDRASDMKEFISNIPFDYVVVPTYSEELLNKLHNGLFTGFNSLENRLACGVPTSLKTAVGTYLSGDESIQFLITQKDGVIHSPYCAVKSLQDTVFEYSYDDVNAGITFPCDYLDIGDGPAATDFPFIHNHGSVCDTWEEVPSYETRVESQIFKYVGEVFIDSKAFPQVKIIRKFTHTSFVLLASIKIYGMLKGDMNGTAEILGTLFPLGGYNIDDYGPLSRFDWHPTIYINTADSGDQPSTLAEVEALYKNPYEVFLTDLDNFYVIPAASTAAILDIAVLSGFTIPMNQLDK